MYILLVLSKMFLSLFDKVKGFHVMSSLSLKCVSVSNVWQSFKWEPGKYLLKTWMMVSWKFTIGHTIVCFTHDSELVLSRKIDKWCFFIICTQRHCVKMKKSFIQKVKNYW